MIDPQAAPYVLVAILAAILIARDVRSIRNLEGFFDSADKLMEQAPHAARIVDDVGDMSSSLLSARLARQMAIMALRGRLRRELREPSPRARAFIERWHATNGTSRALDDLPRRFVWELTRTSLVFGSLFGLWLLWRGAQHWGQDTTKQWTVLAAVAVTVRAAERR
jgi:hypothetical protein